MHISSYILILIFSLFSQGFLLSISKSMRKVEDDDMILNALNIGKALWNEGKTEKTKTTPTLEHYKMEDSSFLDEEEDTNPKFVNIGSKHNFINHGLPLNLGIEQLPYLALKGSMAFPAETEIQNIESIQKRRETGDEENSAKFPIGRRDFDSKYVCIFPQKKIFQLRIQKE
ncbi:pro-MCH isoform X1 [Dermochelys coriacea]|uniref:pro-MCH isoform X1 n=1 Tax=Dermochelys coriacea TaxID=27794 RepID=UPI001CA8B8E5|nr:pro-MCH isoform X1 [Dermochelys coriacea]